MIILLHIIYSYTEYLWSCIVNRNSNSGSNSLTETCETEPEDTVNDAGNIDCTVCEHGSLAPLPDSVEKSVADSIHSNSSTLKSVNVDEFEHAIYDFDTKKIKFYPPVYVQRYVTVVNILTDSRWKNDIKKVVDIGSSELGFFQFLKDIDGLEKIYEIDLDKEVLERHSYRIQPWFSDYMKNRQNPLEVKLLYGNASHPDWHLEKTDAVVAIELIEHMYPEDLNNLPYNIFGLVKPRVAIFTTPNEEFNVLFDNFSGFRHDDHKFEWNRKEFETWAKNICDRYPDYEVNFVGIGPGPKGKEQYGFCSQGAVFVKVNSEYEDEKSPPLSSFKEYEVVAQVEFPYKKETRTKDRIIYDDAMHYVQCSKTAGNFYKNDRYEIPLINIMMRVPDCKSIERLRKIFDDESIYKVETDEDGDFVLIVPEDSCDSDSFEDIDDVESKDDENQYNYVSACNLAEEDWDSVVQEGVPWTVDDKTSECQDHRLNSKMDSKCVLNSATAHNSPNTCTESVPSSVSNPDDCNSFSVGRTLSSCSKFYNFNECVKPELKDSDNVDGELNVEDRYVSENEVIQSSFNFIDGTLKYHATEEDYEEDGLTDTDSSQQCHDVMCDENEFNIVGKEQDQCIDLKNQVESEAVDLNVDSAYDLDECIQNMQVKIQDVSCSSVERQTSITLDKFTIEQMNVEQNLDTRRTVKRNESFTVCDFIKYKPCDVNVSQHNFTKNKQANCSGYSQSISKLQQPSSGNLLLSNASVESCSLCSFVTPRESCFSSAVDIVAEKCDVKNSSSQEGETQPQKCLLINVKQSLEDNVKATVEEKFELISSPNTNGAQPPKTYDFSEKYLEYCMDCVLKSSDILISNESKDTISESEPTDSKTATLDKDCSFSSNKFLYSNDSKEKVLEMHNYSAYNNLRIRLESGIKANLRSGGRIVEPNKKVEELVESNLETEGTAEVVNSCRSPSDPILSEDSCRPLSPIKGDTCEKVSNIKGEIDFSNCAKEIDDLCLNEFLLTKTVVRQDSCSPEKAADSGYPNSSASGHNTMEMDLTPEQVNEIVTESESSGDNSPVGSPVAEEVADNRIPIGHAPLIHLGDDVENGDVANNNRDGEGNNMMGQAVGDELEFHAVIDEEEDAPLMAAAENYDRLPKDSNVNHDHKVISSSEIESGSHWVYDVSTDSCSCSVCLSKNNSTLMGKSNTLMSDEISSSIITLESTSETSSSIHESTTKLSTEDDTDSTNYLKDWDNYRCMVQSDKVKDLKRYNAWLAEKLLGTMSSIPSCVTISDCSTYTDSTPSCSTSDVAPSYLSPSPSLPPYLLISDSNRTCNIDFFSSLIRQNNLQHISVTQSNVPVSVFDEALDMLIRDIVEDLLTPTVEPFADWLLQIQLEVMYDEFLGYQDVHQLPSGETGQLTDRSGVFGQLPLMPSEETLAATDSNPEYIVEADVKGGGDNTVDP